VCAVSFAVGDGQVVGAGFLSRVGLNQMEKAYSPKRLMLEIPGRSSELARFRIQHVGYA